MKLNTDGIILRDYSLEDNRILTILTKKHGLITAFANGAKRTRSRLAGSTEMLCYSDFILFKHRDRYSVDSADLIRNFFGLRADIIALSLAAYFAELSMELATQTDDAESYLKLMLNTLHFLEKGEKDYAQLKALFELRMLTFSGYMPDIVACRECSAFSTDSVVFFPQHGDFLCLDCSQKHNLSDGISISAGILAAMRHIIYCKPAKLFSFSLSEENMRGLGILCEQYLKYQLERTFNTLEFYHSL